MKKILRNIAAFIMVLLAMTACTDLDYENYSQINSDDFPQTEDDLDASAVGVYNTLCNSFIMKWMNNAGIILEELTTDEMNTAWGGTAEQTERYQWTANNMVAKECYVNYQKGITKATRVIYAFENSSVSEQKKNKFIAELRALRALYAYLLCDFVGPVPIVTDPAIANDVYSDWKPSRPSREEYVKFMTDELTAVYSQLDKEVTADNYGRMTQGAALTLLMKIYLNDKQWQKAADAAKQVMDLGVYSMLPSYKSVFEISNEGPSNTEVILPIGRIMSNQSFSSNFMSCVLPATPTYRCSVGNQLAISGGYKMPWSFYDKYEAQDSRLETIIRYYVSTDGDTVDFRTVNHPKATGAAPMKYSEDPDQAGQLTGNDFILFRYADVILSRAEALNELNGPNQESIDLINQVRARANASLISLADYNTKDKLRDFLCDERGRELYCEGHRRTDLVRFGKLIEKVREKGFTAEDYMTVFPIPQSAIDENPNLTQNPGY